MDRVGEALRAFFLIAFHFQELWISLCRLDTDPATKLVIPCQL